ncbi:MAG: hypothetical protein ACI97A_002623 [Planctomycetota bacterium]|jgi:hypothetical protein
MSKKVLIPLGLLVGAVVIFVIYLAFLSDEILVREDIRIYGEQGEVQSYLEDVKNWPLLHLNRPTAINTFSEKTTGPGAWWRQELTSGRFRLMTIESTSLKDGIKFTIDFGGSSPLNCQMAVRKHLTKGLIFIRSATGKVTFFERMRSHAIQHAMRLEIYKSNDLLLQKFGGEAIPGQKDVK